MPAARAVKVLVVDDQMSMRALVRNGLLQRGADRRRLEAKLFGGGGQHGAGEVDALSVVADRLHNLIARHISREDAPEQSIEDAQMIDYLTQHLEALGDFLTELSIATPANVMVDAETARAGVGLADLARRLMGETADEDAGPAGDCELF